MARAEERSGIASYDAEDAHKRSEGEWIWHGEHGGKPNGSEEGGGGPKARIGHLLQSRILMVHSSALLLFADSTHG